jgi:hypothetical protein
MLNRIETMAIPLTIEEKDALADYYNMAVKTVAKQWLVCIFIVTAASFTRLGLNVYAFVNDLFFGTAETWMASPHYLGGWFYKILISVVIATLFAAPTYISGIRSIQSDIVSAVKIKAPFIVSNKEYFPTTGQYFLTLQGDKKHFEVDESTYGRLEEEQTVFVYVSPKARYRFGTDDDIAA